LTLTFTSLQLFGKMEWTNQNHDISKITDSKPLTGFEKKVIYLGNHLKTLLVKGGLPCQRMSLFVKSVKSRLT
jgi:hypothetical protein